MDSSVPEFKRLWDFQEPLSQLNLYRDWDYVASMLMGLRVYFYEHGTIPTWNFLLCGGKPEIANPQSWSYSWLSPLAYLLTPNYALFLLWAVMTAVGFYCCRWLLLRWTYSTWGANIGAFLFAFNGFFTTRFNQGHITFAFYHMVLAIIVVFERSLWANLDKSRIPLKWHALTSLLAFMFVSIGLPHPLLYFYPLFIFYLVFCLVRMGDRIPLWKDRFRKIAPLCFSHLLGIALTSYKLWPVIAWQLIHPRSGVANEEMMSLKDLFLNLVRFIRDYDLQGRSLLNPQMWGLWEYNSYIGPVAIVFIVIGFVIFGMSWTNRYRRRLEAIRGVSGFATIVALITISLCLGRVIR